MLSADLDTIAGRAGAGRNTDWSSHTNTAPAIGVQELVWSDHAVEHRAAVWYPARIGTGVATRYLGVFSARALLSADPHGDGHPLVVMSHGFGGNRYDQAFLAEYLVARGYVCLAVSHEDRGLAHRWRHLFDRPKIMVCALRQVLSSDLAGLVDPSRIALVAHSAGAYAALIAAGATPRFDLEPVLEPAQAVLAQFDPESYRIDSVRAIVLMAPALSNLFDGPGLLRVDAPALILAAELETERLLGTAQAYGILLRNAQSHIIEGAGHYAFINEFPPLLARLSPHVAGGDRHKRSDLHAKIFGPIDNLLNQTMQRPRGSNVA